MAGEIEISVIIPAYNESARIGKTLDQIIAYCSESLSTSEIIVVDDGSRDDTCEIVRRYMDQSNLSSNIRLDLVPIGRNRGKGYCVRTGVLRAVGSIVAFSDADLSSPITELPKLIDPIRRGSADIVIGSRALDRSLIQDRQPFWREYAGRTFNLMMRILVQLPFQDTQCGFKAYRRDLAVPLFWNQTLSGFGFDVEVLYLAWRAGLRIDEVPVIWNHAEGSRVHIVRDSTRMFTDLLKIRLNAFLGKYGPGESGALHS